MNRQAVAPRRGPPGLRRDPSQLFAQVFGFDPSDPQQERSGTVPQALLLMNSPIIDNLLGAERRRGLGELLREFPGDRELIEELYLRTVSRPPDRGETQQALRYLRRMDNRAEGFEDVLWALINSSEFSHRI
jgi:hypothetical protein